MDYGPKWAHKNKKKNVVAANIATIIFLLRFFIIRAISIIANIVFVVGRLIIKGIALAIILSPLLLIYYFWIK